MTVNIKVEDIEPYLELQRKELKFRMHLYRLQELSDERLAISKDLKLEAESLKQFKDRFHNRLFADTTLDKHIMQILNDKFNGRM